MIKINSKLLNFLLRITSKLDREMHYFVRKQKLLSTPAENLDRKYYGTFDLLWIIQNDDYKVLNIYDVGAHHGYWSVLAKSFFINANIHMFEPIEQHVAILNSNTTNLSKVKLFEFGLGDISTKIPINIATASDSSSILKFHDNLFKEYGQKEKYAVEIKIEKAADLIQDKIIPIPDLIKLDIQGYELKALQGFGNYLRNVKYIIIEVSFIELYINQPSLSDIISYLNDYNFNLASINELRGFSKKIIQADMLFINSII